MFRKFCNSPVLAKIKYVNHEIIDSTTPATFVLGSAFHKAMEVYYGGSDTLIPTNEAEAIEYGMQAGMEYIDMFNDGWIKWNKAYTGKQILFDKFTFAFNAYVSERPYKKGNIFSTEEHLKETISVEWNGQRVDLPVPLEGYTDRIDEEDGELVVVDYKVVGQFSSPDKIDGNKMIAAVIYYFLCYAKHGRAPVKMRYEEVKHTKNKDGSPQVRVYDIVYEENKLFFDFFFRLYEDLTRHLNGEAVSMPNTDAMFDGDIELISYIHRLDIDEVRAEKMKQAKVSSITDLLKSDLVRTSSMKNLMATLEKEFISAKTLDYSKMNIQEKIEMKFMEYGMLLRFDSVIQGATVNQYRFTPSIGLKMRRIKGYVDDIEQVLGVTGVRILAPVPDTTFVGIEVPVKERTFPSAPAADGFNIAIGQTTTGEAYRFDIRKAPHMLVAGATGAGKSVFLSSVIRQLSTAENTEIVLCDPKQVELAEHADLPNVVRHVTTHDDIALVLIELVDEMNARYKKLASAGVKNIEGYSGTDMPYKFIVVDEFGDITCGENSKLVAMAIRQLGQMARAAGIHMILATQRPSVKVISGDIKANFDVKVAFRMAKAVDSMVLLDEAGAEKLLGKGDMLFSCADGIVRLQGYKD